MPCSPARSVDDREADRCSVLDSRPRRAARLTHLRAPKLTHPGRRAAAAKALMGKALSSPPAAGGGVTFGVHTGALC